MYSIFYLMKNMKYLLNIGTYIDLWTAIRLDVWIKFVCLGLRVLHETWLHECWVGKIGKDILNNLLIREVISVNLLKYFDKNNLSLILSSGIHLETRTKC